MSNTIINRADDQREDLAVKRQYRQPKLQIFGKVLHLTQGSGGSHHDYVHGSHHKK